MWRSVGESMVEIRHIFIYFILIFLADQQKEGWHASSAKVQSGHMDAVIVKITEWISL